MKRCGRFQDKACVRLPPGLRAGLRVPAASSPLQDPRLSSCSIRGGEAGCPGRGEASRAQTRGLRGGRNSGLWVLPLPPFFLLLQAAFRPTTVPSCRGGLTGPLLPPQCLLYSDQPVHHPADKPGPPAQPKWQLLWEAFPLITLLSEVLSWTLSSLHPNQVCGLGPLAGFELCSLCLCDMESGRGSGQVPGGGDRCQGGGRISCPESAQPQA